MQLNSKKIWLWSAGLLASIVALALAVGVTTRHRRRHPKAIQQPPSGAEQSGAGQTHDR